MLPLGATGIHESLQLDNTIFSELAQTDQVRIAVCGAHLSGLPLNKELTDRQGKLLARTQTSPDYRLYALSEESSGRPGMVHVDDGEQGYAIAVEVWALPAVELGSFVAGIPKPLGIGTISLANGETVHGFLCEHYAVENATDISHLGGWREYLAQPN